MKQLLWNKNSCSETVKLAYFFHKLLCFQEILNKIQDINIKGKKRELFIKVFLSVNIFS